MEDRAGRGGASAARGRSGSLAGARRGRESSGPRGQMKGAMEPEPEVLLQEARENVEAAQSYRRELGQRLQGLREAQRQVGGPLRAFEGADWRVGARGGGAPRLCGEGGRRPVGDVTWGGGCCRALEGEDKLGGLRKSSGSARKLPRGALRESRGGVRG